MTLKNCCICFTFNKRHRYNFITFSHSTLFKNKINPSYSAFSSLLTVADYLSVICIHHILCSEEELINRLLQLHITKKEKKKKNNVAKNSLVPMIEFLWDR